MSDSAISSVSHRDLYVHDPDQDDMREAIVKSADQRAYGVCARAEGLLAGVLCNDHTAVSNACRTARDGTTTAYLCDDRNLRDAQESVEKTTLDILKNIVASALFGRVLK